MTQLTDSQRMQERHLLENYIKVQGMNRSLVREAILDLVGEQKGIFSAEDLMRLAREHDLNIGSTTIYSCIDLFIKIGILMPLPMGLSGTLVRSVLCQSSALSICRHCGEVLLHPNMTELSELQTVTPPRYSDTSPLLLYWGVCPHCYRVGKR